MDLRERSGVKNVNLHFSSVGVTCVNFCLLEVVYEDRLSVPKSEMALGIKESILRLMKESARVPKLAISLGNIALGDF